MLDNERDFYQNVSNAIMKLLQKKIVLNESEKQIISISVPFEENYERKIKECSIKYFRGRDHSEEKK